jgi:Tfp pilus assembly protein PilF
VWYVVTLIPMIGLIPVGSHAMADRFTYVPLIGIFIALVWTVAEISARFRAGRGIVTVCACLTIGSAAVVARAQVGTWRNSETLWRHAMAVTTDNFRAYAGVAAVEAARGNVDAAIANYQSALRLAPDNAEWHVDLGLLFVRQDRVAEAAASFHRAVELRPDDAKAHNNLGAMLARQARWDDAIAQYRRSIELMPGYALAHRNLGLALAGSGDVEGGLREVAKALELAPREDQWKHEAELLSKLRK